MKHQFSIRHSAGLISAIELLISTKTLKPGIGRTLQAIATFWNPQGQIFPSHAKLAAMTGTARRTIVTHVKQLSALDLISTSGRPARNSDGSYGCTSLLYSFNSCTLGKMFASAKAVLKKQAKAASTITSALVENDHTPPPENDHTISSPKGSQEIQITVRSGSLLDWFRCAVQKALQSEQTHLQALAKRQAYRTAVLRNRISRGQEFSADEKRRRALAAAAVRPEREAAAKAAERINQLQQALLTWNRSKTGYTPAMHAELAGLTRSGAALDIMSKTVFEKFAAMPN